MADHTTTTAQPETSAATLWRCGGRQCGAGECEHEENELHRHASGPGGPRYAPPLVHDVLRSSGSPLPAPVRADMERRLGHDFADVRIHTGDAAARSAHAVTAEAFTVGRQVVFAAGRYSPDSQAGRRLLLHELTHVAQNGTGNPQPAGRLRVSSPDEPAEQHAAAVAPSSTPAPAGSPPVSPPTSRTASPTVSPTVSTDTLHRATPMTATDHLRHTGVLPYREATNFASCMEIMGDSEYCNEEVLGIPRPPPPPPPSPVTCVPAQPLTWADFTGAPSAGSTFHALTSFSFASQTSGGRDWVVATFNGSSSWVRPQSADPTNRTLNGCATPVSRCETFFDGLAPGATGWQSLGAGTGCAASPQPDTSLRATNRGECESVLGTECDRVAALESARLLHHEQLHFDLACAMAAKGNAALAATPAPNTQTILTAVRTKSGTQTTAYDNQSNHGCNAASQAAWDTRVAQGLPAVTVP